MKKLLLSTVLVLSLILMPAVQATVTAGATPQAIDWKAVITLTVATEHNGIGSDTAEAGVAADASNQQDSYDAIEPSSWPEPGAGLYFPHSDWPTNPNPGAPYNFTRDIRPAAGDMVWDFDADSSAHIPYYARLTWDISQIPSSYVQVLLVDTGNTTTTSDDAVVDMRTTTEYVWSGGDVRRFQFKISTTGPAPVPPTVHVNYPNAWELVYGTIIVEALASDTDGTVVSVAFDYSSDNATTWHAIGTDTTSANGWRIPWDTSSAPESSSYRIRATASDNQCLIATDLSDNTFTVLHLSWRAELRAQGMTSNTVDNQNYAGSAATASAQYDAYDLVKPGAPSPPYTRLYFPHPDWTQNGGNYAQDIRPPSDQMIWPVEVQSSSSETVKLSWDVREIPISCPTVQLLDGTTHAILVADMRTTSNYQYSSTGMIATRFELKVQANIPLVTVTYPNGGETVAGQVTVSANASSIDSSIAQVAFAYSSNNGAAWSDIGAASSSPFSVSWNTTPLSDGNQYLIRATAADSSNNTTQDTSNAVFTVDNNAPAAPVLSTPSNGATVTTGTPTLKWTAVSDISGVNYNVQVDDDPAFGSPEANITGLTSSNLKLSSALSPGTYYWRVNAQETSGAHRAGGWSSAYSFTVTNPPPAPQYTFTTYPTGTSPRSMAAGDLDGDGHQDLAVANLGSNTVSVFTNNGNGTFQPRVDYATGSSPLSVAIADLDGDGHPDLALTNYGSNTVSVFKNNGNGTFQPRVDYTTGSGPYEMAIADLNGDGHPDLVVVNRNGTTVSVFKNNGNGTFQAKVDYPASGTITRGVAVADLNGDGYPDLAVTNSASNTVSIYKNNGDGTFQPRVDYATGAEPQSVAIGDLDGDGRPDLAVGNYTGNSVSVLMNNGDGTFQPRVDYATGAIQQAVRIADLDGDGHSDLVMGIDGSANTVSVQMNNGDGTFRAKVDYPTGTNPVFVAVANLDGDGHLDVVDTNYGSNTISVFLTTLPPSVTVTYPNGGETVYGIPTVSANATQTGGSIASVAFAYSSDNGSTWNSIGTDTNGADGWSVSWNTTSLTDGATYKVKATATNSNNMTASDQSDATFTIKNILWQAQLKASGNGLTDNDNHAGVAQAGSAQYDVFDVPKPPPPTDYVRLYFPHGDWATNPGDYSRDMRPGGDDITWDFEVVTSFSGQVTLTWDVSQVPSKYGWVSVRDTKNTTSTGDDTVREMRAGTQYTYTSTANVPRQFQFKVSTASFIGTTLGAGWNLLSLPLDANPADWAAQLGDNISPLYVYWYNPVTGSYQMWSSDTPAFNPALGKGYWVKATSQTTIDIVGYAAPNGDFAIHLKPGWNMVGDPFNFAVNWGDAKVRYGGSTVSIIDAHANNWVLKYLYRYDNGTGGYVYDTAPDGSLAPWHGYWVKSLVDADLIIPPTPIPIPQQTWKLAHGYPETSVRGQSAIYFKQLIEQASNGQIKVDIYPNGTLLSSSQSLQGVATGTIDLTFDPPYFQTSIFPAGNLLYLGGMWTGVDQADRVFKSPLWNNTASDAFAAKGIKFLGHIHESMNSVWLNSKVKATDFPDFKGLKFGLRAGSDPAPTTQLGGMVNWILPAAELISAFQQGVVDVYSTGLTTAVTGKMWDMAKYCLIAPLGPQASTVLMNMNTWNALPPEYQNLIQNTIMPQLYDFARTKMLDNEASLLTTAQQNFQFVSVIAPAQLSAGWDLMKTYPITQATLAKAGADIVALIENSR